MTTQQQMTTSSLQIASPATTKANARNERTVKHLIHNTSYTPIIRQFTPKPTSTKGFNGYETIIVKSPKGTSPVVGYYKLTGEDAGAVAVMSAKVDLRQNAYVLKLAFPGEQGNPGKLIISTISR
jgi:hypothetical protein